MADKKLLGLEWSFSNLPLEAGCDEAGRGCLAGPVTAAAVILGSPLPGINDSKKLSEKQREFFYKILTNNKNIKWGIVTGKQIGRAHV